jgi:hypothetical protein
MGNGNNAGVEMANDFDEFPLDDPLLKEESRYMSAVWRSFMGSFFQNLVGYLTQNGIIVPNLTTVQRNAILNPQAGQMIYNTTLNAPQIYQNGAWKTFTTS